MDLKREFSIDNKVYDLFLECEKSLVEEYRNIDEISFINQGKVLKAMQKNKLSDVHFQGTTGYGYDDLGRDALENIYRDTFHSESALVRPQIISGTHALTTALFSNLKYGEELISVSGTPYDTLVGVIGIRKTRGSLIENGVLYNEVDLLKNKKFDLVSIEKAINNKTKMITIQRSKGYKWRKSFTIEEIKDVIAFIRSVKKDVIIMVDNCYGEFVDIIEPSDVGADLVVGSLIKNPGGGIAPVGGYIVGKEELVENCACRLTAPGLGKEVGPTLGLSTSFLQGFFLAPSVVASSLKTAVLCAKIFEELDFQVNPTSKEKRGDIVQAINMKNKENLIKFCQGVQMGAPVDSYVLPEPWAMPGYDCDVIMAAGAFVQGSSIELSADAPIKEPYTAYFQGGLTYGHGRLGVVLALNNSLKNFIK
ncbi:MAG: aminotransferase class I/II-fold pyridoxal phosphate-dependent enzyme [Lachnospirales bacterium]